MEQSWGGGARIRVLDLSGCGLHDADIPLLLNVLSENTHTAIINAHQAARNPRSAQVKRFTLLSSLQTLRLDNNHLTDACMRSIATCLGVDASTSIEPSNSRLQKVASNPVFSGTAVGGKKAPGEWLASNLLTLHTLSLQRNRLGVPGVSALLKILASNAYGMIAPRLKVLDLRVNPVWADKSFVAASVAFSARAVPVRLQAQAQVVGRGRAAEAAISPENALLWWAAGHSIAEDSLLLAGRPITFYTGPHKQVVMAAARTAVENGAESVPVPVPVAADGHMTLDPQRISISINRALDERDEEQRERDTLRKLQLHSEQALGLKNGRRVVKLSDMVNSATEGGDAIVTEAEHMEHIASQGIDEVPLTRDGAPVTHADDVGNTRVQQRRRRRDDAHMVDLLSQCFAGVTTEKNIHAISASLRQLGHPTPRSLLMVDADDMSAHLDMIDPVYRRLLLRCVCDYNFYYEEAVTARRIASSIHQIDEQAPRRGVEEDEARQVDDFLLRSGRGRLNGQTRERLHADVWGWDESRSGSGVSSNSVHSYAHVLDAQTLGPQTGGDMEQGHGQWDPTDATRPQYTLYRQTYRDSESSRPALDLTGRAGLWTGSAARLCESQYFRKSHVDLRRAKAGSTSIRSSSGSRSSGAGGEYADQEL